MSKIKNILSIIGAGTVIAGVAVGIKKFYDDYKKYREFKVDDINLCVPVEEDEITEPDDEDLEDIVWDEDDDYPDDEESVWDEDEDYPADVSNDEDLIICDDDYEDYPDDEESVWDEDEDYPADDSNDIDYYDDEDDYSVDGMDDPLREKTDFEKVCGVTREKAVEMILGCDKSYSRDLLEVLDDGSVAEIYSSLK